MPAFFHTLLGKIALFFTAALVSFTLSAGESTPRAPLPRTQAAAVALASSTAQQATSTQPAPSGSNSSGQTAIIYKYLAAPGSTQTAGVSEDELSRRLQALKDQLTALINRTGNTAALPEYVAASGNSINPYAGANAVSRLSNVTVSGVSGLTASDIPALAYLPSSGGTLSGALTVPYIAATSTTATSAFAGGLTVSGNMSVFGTMAVSNIVGQNNTPLFGSNITPWDQSFESVPMNVTPWHWVQVNNTAITQSSQAYDGSHSMAIRRLDLTGAGGASYDLGALHPGRSYTLSGYYQTSGDAQSFNIDFNLNASSTYDVSGSSNVTALPASNTWKFFSVTITAPVLANGRSNYVWLAANVPSTSETIYFDNLILSDGSIAYASLPPLTYSGFQPRNTSSTGSLVFDGDSLTVGWNGALNTYWTNNIVPPTGYTIVNTAMGGNTSTQIIGAGWSNVDQYFSPEAQGNVVVLWIGANDIMSGFTAASTETNIAQYCRERHRLGWKVLVATLPSISGADTTTNDSKRDAINALLRNDWYLYADGLVDLAANPNIGTDGAYANTTYFWTDGIHMTTAGYAIVTSVMQSAINNFVNLSSRFTFSRVFIAGTSGQSAQDKNIEMYYDTAANAGVIFSKDWSGAFTSTLLNPGGGNVGIGTAAPASLLSLQGTTSTASLLNIASSSGSSFLSVTNNGNVGIGTSTPKAQLQIAHAGSMSIIYLGDNSIGHTYAELSTSADTNGYFKIQAISANGSTFGAINLNQSGGNVGIGTSSPDTLLSVGSATPVGNVAHFENSTGSCYINPTGGSVSCTSDARLKTNVNTLTASSGVDALLQLNPVTFNWTREPAGSPTHSGFIAQDVLKVFPDLVSEQSDGYYTMNYAGLTPYLVKAVQEIASISGAFKDALIAWLGSASNGIHDLYVGIVHAHQVAADELCAGSVCINQQQLAALLAGTGVSSVQMSEPTMTISGISSSTPPTISLIGNNPATIHVGDHYTDLGSTAKDSAGHDLGFTYFVNGTLVSNIVFDTSAAATDTIDYVATDTWGNTSTSTRTVIIQAATTTDANSIGS